MPQYMQRNRCEAMIESIAHTPWLSGPILLARWCGMAPELSKGVPLHNGHLAARRLKNAINHINPLNASPPAINQGVSECGCMTAATSAVNDTTRPRQ